VHPIPGASDCNVTTNVYDLCTSLFCVCFKHISKSYFAYLLSQCKFFLFFCMYEGADFLQYDTFTVLSCHYFAKKSGQYFPKNSFCLFVVGLCSKSLTYNLQ